MRLRLIAALLLLSLSAGAATRRVLYVTTSAGFRHGDAIDASVEVFRQIAQESGVLDIFHTEDLSWISADRLRDFDAVYFFTSGELALSAQQKADLLDFVRQGKGFGGSHSATDTLYTWPEYGDLLGGIFDGHPWAQEASVDVEDPENPMVAHLSPSFRAEEEFYQFRSFSRENVRVLLTLDTRTVNMTAQGINRTDGDFPLVWTRNYGRGRVFYSAFGHFPISFRATPLRTMLAKALLWLTGEIEADASPRPAAPAVAAVRVIGAAPEVAAPGALVAITGERLTSGSSLAASNLPLPVRLAGTHVEVNGVPAPLFWVKPGEVVAQLPFALAPGREATLTVSSGPRAGVPTALRIERAAPGIAAAARFGDTVVLYVVGMGTLDPAAVDGALPASLARTVVQPVVRVNGQPAAVFYSGAAPGLVGMYQINAVLSSAATGTLEIVVEAEGRQSPVFRLGG
jgi:uncharacterized protein (TIGR03437 family)